MKRKTIKMIAATASLLTLTGVQFTKKTTCPIVKADMITTNPRPHLVVPEATVKPKVTASPSDPAWKGAAVISNLTVMVGDENPHDKPVPTEVRVLWDPEYLYVRFTCPDDEIFTEPNKDLPFDLSNGDVTEVFLDPKGDSHQWFEFQLNPRKKSVAILHLLTTEPKSQSNLILEGDIIGRDWWRIPYWPMPKLRTAARIATDSTGKQEWIADFAIPADNALQRLGHSTFAPMTMRANFLRMEYLLTHDPKEPHHYLPMNWAPTQFGCPHISPEAMGYLTLAPKQ